MAAPRPLGLWNGAGTRAPGRPLPALWEGARLTSLPSPGKVRPVCAGKRGRGELARFFAVVPMDVP